VEAGFRTEVGVSVEEASIWSVREYNSDWANATSGITSGLLGEILVDSNPAQTFSIVLHFFQYLFIIQKDCACPSATPVVDANSWTISLNDDLND
jgi:hypothetical protein